jgi:hypothetical protein
LFIQDMLIQDMLIQDMFIQAESDSKSVLPTRV